MKLSEEGSFWVCIWLTAALVVCSITVTIGAVCWNQDCLLLKGGYEECQKAGTTITMWKKVEKETEERMK